MAKTKAKTGSKVIVTCQICGKQLTRAGLIGHMRFKHGRDYKAPMIPVEKPLNLIEARSKIAEARSMVELRQRGLPLTPCCQAKFQFAHDQGSDPILAYWKCSSCGSIWRETVISSNMEKEDGSYYPKKQEIVFEIGLKRQP